MSNYCRMYFCRAVCKLCYLCVFAFSVNGNLKPEAETVLFTCLFSWDLIISPALRKIIELLLWDLVSFTNIQERVLLLEFYYCMEAASTNTSDILCVKIQIVPTVFPFHKFLVMLAKPHIHGM